VEYGGRRILFDTGNDRSVLEHDARRLGVGRVAPAHCTSEPGFAVFLDRFKERFDRAGLGMTIALP